MRKLTVLQLRILILRNHRLMPVQHLRNGRVTTTKTPARLIIWRLRLTYLSQMRVGPLLMIMELNMPLFEMEKFTHVRLLMVIRHLINNLSDKLNKINNYSSYMRLRSHQKLIFQLTMFWNTFIIVLFWILLLKFFNV